MSTLNPTDYASHVDYVLAQVGAERERQDAKWGEQNHVSLDPVLLNRPGGCTPERMAEEYGIPSARMAKRWCQSRGLDPSRPDTWGHIMIEEVAESIEAGTLYGDGPEIRSELVQIAAVAVAWIEAIDRRTGQAVAR